MISVTPVISKEVPVNNIWEPLGVVIPAFLVICGGVFALYKYIKSKQRKELRYSIVTDILLADIRDDISSSNDIKVMVSGKKVQNVRFTTIRVRNSGNVPIKQEDYEIPLWFMEGSMFRSKSLINASVNNTVPIGIPATILNFEDIDKIGISKILLNSGDEVYFSMILSDYKDEIKVNGRVVGVKEIKNEPFILKQPLNFSQVLGQWIGYLLVFLFISLIPSLSVTYFLHQQFISVYVITLITFLIAYFILIFFIKIKEYIFNQK